MIACMHVCMYVCGLSLSHLYYSLLWPTLLSRLSFFFFFLIFLCAVALPALGAQYPVFSATPAAKLLEEGKVHTVEHLINPLAMQHPEHTNPSAAATAATVLPAVSTPPPFQVGFVKWECSHVKKLVTPSLLQGKTVIKITWLFRVLILSKYNLRWTTTYNFYSFNYSEAKRSNHVNPKLSVYFQAILMQICWSASDHCPPVRPNLDQVLAVR